MPAPPVAKGPPQTRPDLTAYIRLASCPECSGRRRMLVEVDDQLRGRCLECGAALTLPLATERQSRLMVVGRAGQGILEIGPDD